MKLNARCLVLVVGVLGAAEPCLAAQYGGFLYEATGTEVTITGYALENAEVEGATVDIPAFIQGLPVTSIGAGAFSNSLLGSVILPSSLTSIGDEAFSGAARLASVVVPDGVARIGNRAFSSCGDLTRITIGGGVTLIGDGAFRLCGLTNVVIPDSVNSLGAQAFQTCWNLSGVTIGRGLTSIPSGAFFNCWNLHSVLIPTNVTSMGPSAFSACFRLTAFEVDPAHPTFSSLGGVLFDQARTTLLICPNGKPGAYVVPQGVTRIGTDAFMNCTNLTSVVIPASVSVVDGYPFAGCWNLTGVFFMGNRPINGADFLAETTAYYVPATTGWTEPSVGLTLPWKNPVILDGTAAVQGGRAGFTFAWAPDPVVVVESSPTLRNPAWTSVSTNVLTGGTAVFSDPDLAAQGARFYRLRVP